MYLLGIETSCDETGIAVYDSDRHHVTHTLYSQVALHAPYGGVVPELASRDHIRQLSPLVTQTLNEANITAAQLQGVAYTAGPGLIGALLTGAAFARSFAWALDVPAIPIHHLEGHLLAPLLEETAPHFPFLALLVTGGHTQIIIVNEVGQYQIIGDTVDDAVGEAFDKTAKLLGLPYPGGPQLAKLAEQGEPDRFTFTRPMLDRPGLDFSFSGLKTQVRQCYQQQIRQDAQLKADIANAFQKAAIDTLYVKCQRALAQTGLTQLVIAGGVSANQYLRQVFAQKLAAALYFPRLAFCTDNGAMIAFAGYQRLIRQQIQTDLTIQALPRWSL